MRFEHGDGIPVLTLSRRNLLSLLAKLDGHPPASFCTLVGDGFAVVAEEDEEHYEHRPAPAGRMHPDTEGVLG